MHRVEGRGAGQLPIEFQTVTLTLRDYALWECVTSKWKNDRHFQRTSFY